MHQLTYDNGGSETGCQGTGRSWRCLSDCHPLACGAGPAALRALCHHAAGPVSTAQLPHMPAIGAHRSCDWERFATLAGSLRAQGTFRLTSDVIDMSNTRLLALYPAKEWQGSALAPYSGIRMVVVPASACLIPQWRARPQSGTLTWVWAGPNLWNSYSELCMLKHRPVVGREGPTFNMSSLLTL